MFYFVPSWYNPSRTWYDTTKAWYDGKDSIQFDDTLSQMRMFQSSKEPLTALVLNYAPNLRYFLHKNDLLEIPYFSVFDDIQGIGAVKTKIIDFKDLTWPQEIEFIYTPFSIQAYLGKDLFAKVDFGEDGQVIWIDYYIDGFLQRKCVFDDRGFLSSIIYYTKEGAAYYQEYLDYDGQWQIREYLLPKDKHVQINPNVQERFKRDFYADIEDLIFERTFDFFSEQIKQEDTLVVASDKRHNDLILSMVTKQQLILSFFKNRYPIKTDSDGHLAETLPQADLVLSDSSTLAEQLQSNGVRVQHLSPFDARLTLGESQHIQDLILYVLLDGFSQEMLSSVLPQFFQLLMENENVKILFVSYDNDKAYLNTVKDNIQTAFERFKEQESCFGDFFFEDVFEIADGSERDSFKRISLLSLYSEYEIIQVLNTVRLIIDLGDEPDLYTQIAGISAGIPQINKTANEFVEHKKNGCIIETSEDLKAALDYFLKGLKNWNESLVYSVQKISDYTSGKLVQKIKDSLMTDGKENE